MSTQLWKHSWAPNLTQSHYYIPLLLPTLVALYSKLETRIHSSLVQGHRLETSARAIRQGVLITVLCFTSQLNLLWIWKPGLWFLYSLSISSPWELHLFCLHHTVAELIKFPKLSSGANDIYPQVSWKENWSQIFEAHSATVLKMFSV